MLGNLINFIIIILLFSACIFVHELGHFLAAMWRGLRIERFAVGFGPKIWGTTREWTDRHGRKQKTEFCVCWLPFGGYVLLPQISPLDEKQLREYNPPLTPVSPTDKIITAVAGPLFNVVFAFIVACAVMAIGVPVDKSEFDLTLGYVTPDSVEAKAGLKQGDRILAVNGRPVRDWSGVEQAIAFSLRKEVDVTVQRDGQTVTVEFEPERLPIFKIRHISVGPRVTTVVERVDPGTPAAEAGLRAEDRILAVDEMEVIGPMHLLDLIGERAGKTTALLVRRGEEKITLTVVPRMPKGGTVGKIGIRIYPLSEAGTTIVRPSPIRQVKQVLLMMGNTLAALLHPKQTGVTPGDLSGPVGIGHILLITIAKGFVYALSFIVLININLAILNLLPIPVLDGGHVMFALIEAARRRPLSFRVASVIQSAFAALLITFIVYVTYNDVMRLFMSSRLKPKAPEKLEFTEPTPSEQHAPSPATPPPAPAP